MDQYQSGATQQLQHNTNGLQNMNPQQLNNLLQQYNNIPQQQQQQYNPQHIPQQSQHSGDMNVSRSMNDNNNMLLQQQQQQQQQPMSTCFCTYCNTHLSFPATSSLIQCPSCMSTMDPNQHLQVQCIGCSRLLAYPATSLYIQVCIENISNI